MFRAKATILCVDDRWNDLIAHKLLLERNGYRVIEATNGSDAIALLLSRPVDAIILDYQLPGTGGDVVATHMKRLKPKVPIVLLSSYGPLPENKLKAVDAFLFKRQAERVLLSTLQELLHGWSKPFFHRWLDQWKGRNHGARP